MSGANGGGRKPLNVAVAQMTSVDDWDSNFESVGRLLREIVATGPCDLACFPENALYFRLREGDPMPAIDPDDARLRQLAQLAAASGIAVHLGSVPMREANGVFSASVLLRPDGAIERTYRKIHLFDVEIDGMRPIRESDAFLHGSQPAIFELKGWRFGQSICYDLRFAELYLFYARAEVDAILIPAAFLAQTGRVHWEVLTRARAIESQAYVLAAAQGGTHCGSGGGTRQTWGHSSIIDPWGTVIAHVADNSEARVLRCVLEHADVERVRRQVPMARHRRL
jgi:predicted amidohydrolase